MTESPSDALEAFFQQIAAAEVKKPAPTFVTGVSAEDQIIVDEWLVSHNGVGFIERGSKPQKLLGLVWNIIDYPKDQAQEVSYLDENGTMMVFFYWKNEQAFKDVPTGFSIGDVIISDLGAGYATKSVKILPMRPEEKKELVERWYQLYKERH